MHLSLARHNTDTCALYLEPLESHQGMTDVLGNCQGTETTSTTVSSDDCIGTFAFICVKRCIGAEQPLLELPATSWRNAEASTVDA